MREAVRGNITEKPCMAMNLFDCVTNLPVTLLLARAPRCAQHQQFQCAHKLLARCASQEHNKCNDLGCVTFQDKEL